MIDSLAPSGDKVTELDVRLMPVYIKLLDMEAEKKNWQYISRELLQIDPVSHPDLAKQRYESFYARAIWMTDKGVKQISKITDPQEMFHYWAASILTDLVMSGKIKREYHDYQELNQWAWKMTDNLIKTGDLTPDPDMSACQCAEKFLHHLKNQY